MFDILFAKGKDDESPEIDMMGATLSDRKQVLAKIVNEVQNVIEVVVGKECKTAEEVFECFNCSVKNNEEGIIIKA